MTSRKSIDVAANVNVIPLNRGAAHASTTNSEQFVRQEVTRSVTDIDGIEDRAGLARFLGGHADRMRFPRQIYPLRVLGLALGLLCVGGTLATLAAPAWVWGLLLLNTLAWPHAAVLIARISRDPRRAEFRNLAIDSMLGGAWVAAMQVAIVPSAVLVAMLAMDKAAVGGVRLLVRCLGLHVLVFAVVWTAIGMPFQPDSTTLAVLATLPLVVLYPLAIAFALHGLGQRVRDQNRALHALNRTDQLTALANRRHWEHTADTEYHRCDRSGRPAALLMIDLDGFKTINDCFGHAFGDEVLRRVGLAIGGCLREIDTAARFGGDEFAVVLPEAREDAAMAVAARIRAAVAAQVFERAPLLHCTASIGVAEVARSDGGLDGWLERADRALYQAKAAGRDCVRSVAP